MLELKIIMNDLNVITNTKNRDICQKPMLIVYNLNIIIIRTSHVMY